MINQLKRIVDENQNRIFYKSNDKAITYRELWEKSNILACSLNNQGSEPVVIYGDKDINMVLSIVACLICKRTYIPVGLYTPAERMASILRNTKASLVINNSDSEIGNLSAPSLTVEEINNTYFNEKSMIANNDNSVVYIIFTSGSTGEPKGVPISEENLKNFINWISNFEVLKDYQNITVLNQASFSFDLSVADFYYSLYNHHTLVALDRDTQADLSSVLKVVKDNGVNLMVITPTFIKFMLLDERFNRHNYPALNCIYFCGELLEVATVKRIKERFGDINIINAYGPTEATSAVSGVVIQDQMLNEEFLPVGKTETSAVEIKIIDDEIVLKGKSVFSGYLHLSSKKCFQEDDESCFKTNDLGYYLNDYLYCRGRKDHQIKYSGYRIELGDIENNLLKIDGVTEAVVVAKRRKNNTVAFLKAYIVVNKNIEIAYIKEELKKKVPEYMIPKTIKIMDRIPVNNNGKYDRKMLEEL